jgi:hypothetical protein
MTEPEGDYGLVDAMLQQFHRRAVSKDVRTDALARERWTRGSRGLAVLAHEMHKGITA